MKPNKDRNMNRYRQAVAGIRKHFASAPTIGLGGTLTKPDEAIATLQAAMNAIDLAAAAEQGFHGAVATQHAALAKGNIVLTELKALVQSQLGSSAGVLGDFGFTKPKRKTPDEATKAAAVAKRASTRKARHTMGKRQRAEVKGPSPEANAHVADSGTPASGGNPAGPTVPAVGTSTPTR
jgi:hypothetical protein